MCPINKSFEIPDDNPFKYDVLERRNIIESIMTLFHQPLDNGLVLSIDSACGTGKTTFIRMWEKYLAQQDEYVSLYFNAWENDDFEDPLLVIISLMEEKLSKGIKANKCISNIVNLGKQLLKITIPAALKIATHGIVNLENVKLGEFNEDEIIELAGKIGELHIQNFKRHKNLKNIFKNSLIEYQRKENKKVVIFIDELDRCRPTFAIETLERIKHLFDVPNYVFVLSLDKIQLSHSISTLYGNNMDSIGYLRRFIDLDFQLPPLDSRKYFSHNIHSKSSLWARGNSIFWSAIYQYCENYNFSLRDLEKLIDYLEIVLPSINLAYDEINYDRRELNIILSYIYATFVMLKFKNPMLYNCIYLRDYNLDDIENIIKQTKISQLRFLESHEEDRLKNYCLIPLDHFLAANLTHAFNNDKKYLFNKYLVKEVLFDNKDECILFKKLNFITIG